jgi:hypothetical protein
LRAIIKGGEIDVEEAIGSDHDEERPQEWIDGIFIVLL